jgi:hypothetical protein
VTIGFRPLERDDLPRLERWLEADHVHPWREPSEDVEAELGPVLAAFARDVVFADPAVRACVAGVDVRNERSLRAFAKAGFRPVCDYVEEGRPHRLLRLERGG